MKEFIITTEQLKQPMYSRLPFYYGWVILVVGGLGILASIPGQTMGVSVFTDHLIQALHVTRVNISSAYMAGTLASALLIPYAGKLYDRYGARISAAIAALCLGGFLFLMAKSGDITSALAALLPFQAGHIGFALAMITFFGIRFFGQGVLTLVSRGMVVRWFSTRQGLAVGFLGITTSFGFSFAPQPLQGLINTFGWQGALLALAGILILVFLPLVLLLYRSDPASCGMAVEEGMKIRISRNKQMPAAPVDARVSQARRDLRYWIVIAMLCFWSMYNTAFTFHVVSIFSQVGMETAEALRIFLPIGVISLAARFISSYLSDRINLKYLIITMTLFMGLAGSALFVLSSNLSVLLIILGMGIGAGIFSMLNVISWPKLFGKKYLGEVSGFAMGFVVAGSAVGPWLFSMFFQYTGSYRFAGLMGLVLSVVLLALILPISFTPKAEEILCEQGKKAIA